MKNLIIKLLKLAKKSEKLGEFPVSAIIYKDDKIISSGFNKRNKSKMTTDHAEIVAIQKANKKLKTWRLNGYNILITLEPCDMCKAVIKESRLDNVYYLVDRYKYKKPCKNTGFKKYKIDKKIVDNYIVSIKCFFTNKR